MRKIFAVAVVIAAMAAGNQSLGADKTLNGSVEKYAQAETNLLVGLASDNQGLKESAAYMLGEIKSDRAVVPLMRMLKDSEEESSRVVAALALCRIGDARGVFAVKQATRFDESTFVQQRCAWFYDQYVVPGSFNFAATQSTDTTPLAAR
jgi:HEAT repeat protein